MKRLACFATIAFSITWGLAGLLFALRERIESLTGAISAAHPLFMLAVYGPAIAAIAVGPRRLGAKSTDPIPDACT